MDKLSLSLLGPFEALLAKRPLPPFRTSKIQALLIYLAVSASENTAVSHRREAVMELLWSDILRKSAQDNLRQTLYLLRKAIPPQKNANGEQILLILSNRLTVQLNPDYPIDVDITRFSKLVKQAGTGSREETAVFLEEAVTLYRGDFLTDFYLTDSSGFEAWAAAKRAMFRERVFTALDSLSSFFAATEEHEKAAQYARKQLALDDLRETAVRQLMHALVKMGQRSQALAEYEQCQQRLFHELNVEPSQETQSLAKQIQADEVRQTIVTAVQPVPEKLPVQPVPHNLPVQPTPFIGRELELSKLDELVTQSNNRLVTIVGPGGMGKTRLALAWAEQCRDTISGQRQFPDGLFFVNLAPLNLGDSMISTLATALEFPLGGSQDKRPPAQQILDYLEKKQLLLIMDNFEHLIPHPSASLEKMQDHVALVNSILQRATTVTLIITSRERLHLRAEQVYPIQGLLFPDWETPEDALTYTAVQLFLQSAQRNQPNFTLSAEQDLKYLARICRLVEGMPLALELAASWVDALSLADIAAEIRHGFDFLETEMRDMPERHRSMRAVLDGSWKQLGETETRIFEQLSVFRGGFTRAAAQEVADASVRQLARLVQKSLLYVDEENGRYHLHELVRQYGAEKLAVDRERETAVCDQHSQYYCTLLSERESDLKGARQADALNELEIEFNNIRTAWHRAVAHFRIEDVTQAMNALGFFLVQKVSLDDSLTIFQRLWENLDKADTSDLNQVLASVLCWQSSFVFDAKLREKYRNRIQSLLEQPPLNQLDYWPQKPFVLHRLAKLTFLQDQHVTRQRLEESLNYYQVAGDRWGESEILLELGYLALFYNIQDVASFQEKSLQMKRSIGDLKGISQAVYLKAKLLIDQGHLQDSKSLLQEFMEINQKLDSKRGIAGAFYNLGFVDLLEGKFDSALRNFYESLDINRLLGSGEPIALNKSAICWVYCHKGEYKIAKKWGNESLEIAQTHIFPHIIIYAHNFLGMAALGQSTFHLAENHLQNSKTLLDEQGGFMPDVLAENRSLWAIVQLQQDNALISRQHLIKALQEYTKSEAFSYIALAITGGALFMLDQQHVERAVELYALASMNPLVANSRWYKDVAGNVIKETATETLSQVELQAARTRGQQLDLKETAVSLLQELQEWDHNKPVQPPVNAGQPIFLNRYVQGELLATGGQGTVYHGYDKATGDAVAIKRLQEAQQPQNENLIQRFIREGEALRQLNHPNIVKMLAAPEQNGEHVIIMEYVAGGSLRDLLERDGPLPINRVLSIALELADALTRAHHMGIIHRDLKPANVLLAEDGTPRLTDFGIARMSNQVTHLTQPGSFMGSPTYMSPEACRGELLDTRSDIWSFGVLLYEMLAGRPPFQEEQVTALIIAIINDPIPDLTQFCPDTPPALINLIAQMLAKEHDQRPSSVRQIAAGLENIPPLGT